MLPGKLTIWRWHWQRERAWLHQTYPAYTFQRWRLRVLLLGAIPLINVTFTLGNNPYVFLRRRWQQRRRERKDAKESSIHGPQCDPATTCLRPDSLCPIRQGQRHRGCGSKHVPGNDGGLKALDGGDTKHRKERVWVQMQLRACMSVRV